MIRADLHNHTWYSHGAATTAEMFAAAQKTDLEWFGFSEHSPLPSGYACGLYRHGDLSGVFPEYAREVMELRRTATRPKVLFGMELDWIPSRRDFMETLVAAYPSTTSSAACTTWACSASVRATGTTARPPVLPAMTLIMKRWRTWPPPGWWM